LKFGDGLRNLYPVQNTLIEPSMHIARKVDLSYHDATGLDYTKCAIRFDRSLQQATAFPCFFGLKLNNDILGPSASPKVLR